MANPLEITFVAASGTPGFSMLPSSEPGIGEEIFAVYPRSSRDPIFAIQAQTDLASSISGIRSRHVSIRLDRGTDITAATTNPSKPMEISYGTSTSPLNTGDGAFVLTLNSNYLTSDTDLELGNLQSYMEINSTNTNPYYTVGISQNINHAGTGGDGTAWTVSGVPSSNFKTYASFAETGSIERHHSALVGQFALSTASGTAAKAFAYVFHGPLFDLIGGCTSPGTCIDLDEVGLAYVPNVTVGNAAKRYTINSKCTTCQLEHPGRGHFGPSPTPTVTATATAATPTPTAASPTPTATKTPLVDVDGHLGVAGDILLKDTGAARLLQPLGRVNQNAFGFTVKGIDAVTMPNNGSASLTGGAITVLGGGGTSLGAGGDAALQGGAGFNGSNCVITAPLPFSGGLTAAGRVLVTGHLTTKQTGTPSVSAGAGCGTTPSVTGNDHNGTITVGTGATQCTLTFGRAWANTPQCFANDRTAVLSVRATPTTTTVVFATLVAADIASDTIDYWCVGRE